MTHPNSAIISGITLTTGGDRNSVESADGWQIETVDREAKRISAPDGKTVTLHRDIAMGIGVIPLPDFPASFFTGCEEDKAELERLYAAIPNKRLGEILTWNPRWDEPQARTQMTELDARLIIKLITAADFLKGGPVLWDWP